MNREYGAGAYTKAQVTTTTNQKDLIVMAYDGILKFLNRGKEHISKEEVEGAHNALIRARDILEELASTLNLDEGGEIAKNLWNLYIFFMQKVTEANLTKDPKIIDEISPSIHELREAWASLEISKDDSKTQALNLRVPSPEAPRRLSVAG